MSNTLIQIKRSTSTAIPSGGTLSAGELAYSYQSNVAYVGNSDGTGVLPIGGQLYVAKTNSAYDIATAAFEKANSGDTVAISAAFDKANSANYYAYLVDQNTSAAFAKANVSSEIAIFAYDKANSANLLAYNTGIGANAFAAATIAGANAAVGAGANSYADSVGVNVGSGANSYADSVGVNVGSGANSYAAAAAVGANNYSNATFVKLTAANQTITGNVAITGKLVVSGNAQFLDTETLRINDPLIYLAGNNYSSDIVDIGFIANYNDGSANLHTGLFREHTNKEYYLFQGYTEEPYNNHIDPSANGFTLAVLNAAIRTSNLVLGSTNAIPWITAAFDQANSAFNKANSGALYAFSTVVANGISLVADSNTDTLSVTQSNGIVITANAGTDTFDISLGETGVTAGTYGESYAVPTFTVDSFGRISSVSTVSIAIDASAITSGILGVERGGTGKSSFDNNGVLFGNTTGALKVTSAGSEGQVLQANDVGTPYFGMLDGGSF